jgi:hypothetical protein
MREILRTVQVRVGRAMQSARSEGAQALAEFALIAPLLCLLIFGIIDAARMMQSYVTIQGAAREGARYAVTGRSDCDLSTPTRYDCIIHVTEETSGNLDQSEFEVSVRSWAFSSGGYASTPTEDDAGIQCDNVEVSVEYQYHMITPLLSGVFGDVPMTASERLVNEPFGACGVEAP